MLSHLLHALTGQQPVIEIAHPDEAQALGALMVRVIKLDGAYDLAEVKRLDLLLAQLFDLKRVDAVRLRALSEKLEREAPQTEVFAELVRLGVDFEVRFKALVTLWRIVLNAPTLGQDDKQSIERLRLAMGLTEADSVNARSQAVPIG